MKRPFFWLGKCLRFLWCLPRTLLSLPILAYRRWFSRAKGKATCRFTPTCSQYALTALAQWGAIIGTLLTVWRLLRCQPFSRGGYDPVPTPPWHKKEGRECDACEQNEQGDL